MSQKLSVFSSVSVLIAMVFYLSGCGVQRGQYSTSSVGQDGVNLQDPLGYVQSVRGHKLKFGCIAGPEETLMYVLVIWDGIGKVKGQKFSGPWTRFKTELYYSVTDEEGTYPLSLTWNRFFDTVNVKGKIFRRKEGQVFAIARTKTGEIMVEQFQALEKNVTADDIVALVKSSPKFSAMFARRAA